MSVLILYVAKYGATQYFKAVLCPRAIWKGLLEAGIKHFVGCPATSWVFKHRCDSPFLLGSWWHKSLSGSSSNSSCCSEPQVWHHYQESSTQVSRSCRPTLWRLSGGERLVKPSSLVGSWLNVVTVNSEAFQWQWPLLNLESEWTPPPFHQ